MKIKLLNLIKSKIFSYIVVLLLFRWLMSYPEIIEKYYSNGFYFYISNGLRMVFGIFGFSVGDVIIFLTIAILITKSYRYIKFSEKNFKKDSLQIIEKLLLLFILFQILWGFNYSRVPLAEKLNLKTEYSEESLLIFTEKLIVHTNKIQRKITKNKDSIVVNHTLQSNMYRNAVNDFKNIQEDFPQFYFKNQSSKSSLWSLWLSITGFGGYFNPFTGEIQVNTLQPNYDLPTLLCHEMSHQIGFASESEANFIAVLTTIKSDNLLTHYSGCTYLLKYCLHNLSEENKEKCKKKINIGILKNYEQDKQHHEKYNTFLNPIMKKFYNQFLLFNNQKNGIEDYNHFIGMIIDFEDKNTLLKKRK